MTGSVVTVRKLDVVEPHSFCVDQQQKGWEFLLSHAYALRNIPASALFFHKYVAQVQRIYTAMVRRDIQPQTCE
jgi:hypothetical protein